MSERIADLGRTHEGIVDQYEIAWHLGTERQSRIHGYSYQGTAVPVSKRDSRLQRYLAAGLLALARWMAPVEYAERMTPAASPVLATG